MTKIRVSGKYTLIKVFRVRFMLKLLIFINYTLPDILIEKSKKGHPDRKDVFSVRFADTLYDFDTVSDDL